MNGIRTRGLFFNICIQGYPKGMQGTLTSNSLIFAGYKKVLELVLWVKKEENICLASATQVKQISDL